MAYARAKENSLFKNLQDSISFQANEGLYEQAPSSIDLMGHQ